MYSIKTTIGFANFVVAEAPSAFRRHIKAAEQKKAQKRYDKAIAKSQAKIGPYKPATIPVQVWA